MKLADRQHNIGTTVTITAISCILLCFLCGFSYSVELVPSMCITLLFSLVFIGISGFLFKEKINAHLFRAGASLFLAFYVLYLYCSLAPIFLTVVGFCILGAIAAVLIRTHRFDVNTALILLILAGFLLRLDYIFSTTVSVRQHDVGIFTKDPLSGHSGYIEYFFNWHTLPDFDPRSISQFYHPPLHHMIAAFYLHVQKDFGIAYDCALEGLQFLTLFYSCTASLLAIRLCRLLGISSKALLICAAVIVFSPAFIIFSGSINNDILSVVFILAALCSAYGWYLTDKTSSLLSTAVFIGLGMMTKISASIIAVPIACLMLQYFIKTKKKLNCCLRYALFGSIAFPLGLWWPVRNYLLFSLPMQYVPKLSLDNVQYVGFRGFAERFFPFRGFGNIPYFSWSGDMEYNAWSGLIKSSCFGEYTVKNTILADFISNGLFVFTLLVCISAFIAMIYILFFKKAEGKYFMSAAYITLLGSYLSFCYQFPHTCTMNIRYASPLIAIGAFFLGAAAGERKNKTAYYFTVVCVGGFVLFATAFYAPVLWFL